MRAYGDAPRGDQAAFLRPRASGSASLFGKIFAEIRRAAGRIVSCGLQLLALGSLGLREFVAAAVGGNPKPSELSKASSSLRAIELQRCRALAVNDRGESAARVTPRCFAKCTSTGESHSPMATRMSATGMRWVVHFHVGSLSVIILIVDNFDIALAESKRNVSAPVSVRRERTSGR